jgi:hypothetical protein
MSFYIREDGTVGGGVLIPLERQKELAKKQDGIRRSEPNMVMETKEEVIDTIAKKEFSKESLIQNTGIGTPRNMLFVIKKGDPIQVIKKTNIGTLQTDVFYYLRKHNGKNYAKLESEIQKQNVAYNSNFKGYINFGNSFQNFEYDIPKDVVEEPTIVGEIKKLNPKFINIVLLGLLGFVIYKLIKK